MVEEMEAWTKKEVLDLVKLPEGRKPIGRKWVFKKKLNVTGKVKKWKYQLIAKGSSQVEGIEFHDIFSPIAKITSIILLFSLVVAFDLEVDQMDVKTMFLHGDLEE